MIRDGEKVFWAFAPGLAVEVPILTTELVIIKDGKTRWWSSYHDKTDPSTLGEIVNAFYSPDAPIGHSVQIDDWDEVYTSLAIAKEQGFGPLDPGLNKTPRRQLVERLFDSYNFIYSTHETPWGLETLRVRAAAREATQAFLAKYDKIHAF